MNTIITISRQFGSGGRVIGEMLANKLGLPYYNKQIVDQTAEKLGYAKEFIQSNEQKMKGVSSYAFGASIYGGSVWTNVENFETKIFNMEAKVLEEIASNGPCVIVGRCADYCLKNKYPCFNIFVHADMEARIKRIMDVYMLAGDRKKAEKMIKDTDKQRGRHYKYFTDEEWGDANNYDLSICSSKFGLEKTVDIIAAAYLEIDKEK